MKVFSISGRVLKADSEQFLLVTFEDITNHKEAERLLKSTTTALGRSQEDLRALTSSLLTSQETERRRIARELHDDVSQRLARLEIETDEAEEALPHGTEKAATKMEQYGSSWASFPKTFAKSRTGSILQPSRTWGSR